MDINDYRRMIEDIDEKDKDAIDGYFKILLIGIHRKKSMYNLINTFYIVSLVVLIATIVFTCLHFLKLNTSWKIIYLAIIYILGCFTKTQKEDSNKFKNLLSEDIDILNSVFKKYYSDKEIKDFKAQMKRIMGVKKIE